jgi:hypothetical protein
MHKNMDHEQERRRKQQMHARLKPFSVQKFVLPDVILSSIGYFCAQCLTNLAPGK